MLLDFTLLVLIIWNMVTITIPRKVTKGEELVVISRKEYERFLRFQKHEEEKKITEADILRWSREARKLKKTGKLPLFENLIKKEYPDIAKKYKLAEKIE